MQRPGDAQLVAFLDGELDDIEADAVAAWLARDPGLRARLSHLCEATILLRAAFEPAPEEILPTRRSGSDSAVLRFRRPFGRVRSARRWIGLTMAASAACFMLGVSLNRPETGICDGSPETAMALPSDVIRPDLKPWGLTFVGGCRLIADGKPAVQFSYTTRNKELGSVTLFVTSTAEPDAEPIFGRRGPVNLLYWRRHGHGYYIIAGANDGWMWNLRKDIAYQLKAI